jgi:hypothetical protein
MGDADRSAFLSSPQVTEQFLTYLKGERRS